MPLHTIALVLPDVKSTNGTRYSRPHRVTYSTINSLSVIRIISNKAEKPQYNMLKNSKTQNFKLSSSKKHHRYSSIGEAFK
jgi:hypothetical protein